jgi:hypothetical protein
MADHTEKPVYKPADFLTEQKLYIGYRKADINDGSDSIELNFFRFPDFSCQWERFSKPENVRLRENGLPTDGCISIKVENAQYEKMATPCHDPNPTIYAHTEIRQLKENEPLTFEPPKCRKLSSHNWSKTQKREYRQHLVHSHNVEIEALA